MEKVLAPLFNPHLTMANPIFWKDEFIFTDHTQAQLLYLQTYSRNYLNRTCMTKLHWPNGLKSWKKMQQYKDIQKQMRTQVNDSCQSGKGYKAIPTGLQKATVRVRVRYMEWWWTEKWPQKQSDDSSRRSQMNPGSQLKNCRPPLPQLISLFITQQ